MSAASSTTSVFAPLRLRSLRLITAVPGTNLPTGNSCRAYGAVIEQGRSPSRYSRSLLRNVRMLMPSSFAA